MTSSPITILLNARIPIFQYGHLTSLIGVVWKVFHLQKTAWTGVLLTIKYHANVTDSLFRRSPCRSVAVNIELTRTPHDKKYWYRILANINGKISRILISIFLMKSIANTSVDMRKVSPILLVAIPIPAPHPRTTNPATCWLTMQ